ncbi:hypothetical protein JCGZ_26612 [Jatropha curcas]|uniref:Uncharacterized protein n=1 Tax=Jatropha curcas TaxID=180498 RepID=A0A067JNK1_JATCU|nr:hypothetical protein JCGZ_26612 [Jatropha curcas]
MVSPEKAKGIKSGADPIEHRNRSSILLRSPEEEREDQRRRDGARSSGRLDLYSGGRNRKWSRIEFTQPPTSLRLALKSNGKRERETGDAVVKMRQQQGGDG